MECVPLLYMGQCNSSVFKSRQLPTALYRYEKSEALLLLETHFVLGGSVSAAGSGVRVPAVLYHRSSPAWVLPCSADTLKCAVQSQSLGIVLIL